MRFIFTSNFQLPMDDEVAEARKKLVSDPSAAKNLGAQAATFAVQNHTIEKVSDYYLGLINDVYDGGAIG